MNTKKLSPLFAIAIIGLALAACGRTEPTNLKQIDQKQSGDYTVTMLNETGQLKNGKNTLMLEFRKTSDNQLVDVGKVQINAAMTGMNMSSETSVEPTNMPGRYQMKADFSMAGRWDMTVTFANGQSVRFSQSAL